MLIITIDDDVDEGRAMTHKKAVFSTKGNKEDRRYYICPKNGTNHTRVYANISGIMSRCRENNSS